MIYLNDKVAILEARVDGLARVIGNLKHEAANHGNMLASQQERIAQLEQQQGANQ